MLFGFGSLIPAGTKSKEKGRGSTLASATTSLETTKQS